MELSLVIAIESGLVRGSLVLFHKNSSTTPGKILAPHIFYASSLRIIPHGDTTARKLLTSMLHTVTKVAQDVIEKGLKIENVHTLGIPITKTHLIFSSPWILSKSKTVKVLYDTDTTILKETVNSLIDTERNNLEKQLVSEPSGRSDIDLAFIEQKVFEIKLNGYPTIHYEGKMARELEVSFVISIGSKSILDRIEKAIERALRMDKRNIEYHSALMLQYSALRTIASGENNSLIVHVHDEISDVIAIQKGICAAIISFPLGTEMLSLASSSRLKQLKNVAHSSLNLHTNNAFHSHETKRIATVADFATNKWFDELNKAISETGLTDQMPHTLYLLANAHYQHFARVLDSHNFKVKPIDRSILDYALSHERKENEDPLISLYIFSLIK